MRILHVDHSSVLGGAERSVLELARAQIAIGHDVVVAVGRAGPFTRALAEAGVPWRDLRWSERYVTASRRAGSAEIVAGLPDAARAAHALRRLTVAWRPDAVHAHTRKSQLMATLALAGRREPLLWHLRDDLPARPPLRAAIRFALRRADHAVALSRWLVAAYDAQGAVPRSRRIGVVPSGIDPHRLASLATPWLDGQRPPVIGYVGQIAAWKGPHLLVDAAERLGHLDARFVLIGGVSFPAAEEAYGNWLRRRVEGSSARGRLVWLPPTTRPEDAFAQIDVLAHTSVEPEPFGRVLVEAMAARRPIVALSRGSATELLDDSIGVFAERPDGEAIARAVELIVGDVASARRFAERASGRATAYEPAAVAARMDAEYAEVAG